MPYRKRKFNRKRKAPYRRKKISRSLTLYNKEPISAHYFCKMGYSENYTITSTSGVPNGHLFKTNGLYDPDKTGIGHQPYGHDTLITLYSSYIVTGCRITVRATASSNCIITMRATSNSTTPINLTLESERPDCKTQYLTNGESKSITMYVPNHTLFGRTKSQYISDDIFRGISGADPANEGYISFCVQHPDQGSTVAAYCNVDIVYYVKWMNRMLLSQS